MKRALRSYRGPDNPESFMAEINAMSFHCANMKSFNPNGVFRLVKNTPHGRVELLRINDVDYIRTKLTQNNYFVFCSAWSPFVYVYDLIGNLCWIVDPRTEGNYEDWFQSVYEAYSGGFNLIDLYSGDQTGFDVQYSDALEWGYVATLQRFSYSGGLKYYLAFTHDEVPLISRYNCEFSHTRLSSSIGHIIIGMTTWLYRSLTNYRWFREQCDLAIYRDEDGTPIHITTMTITNIIANDFFWMWGSRWMEDDCFYVALYGNKEEYNSYARWMIIWKIDYDGNILKQTASEQFPTNSDHLYKFDTGSGLLRTNRDYVVHFSTYGQFIRVWSKDLIFIKNISVDPNIGNYGRVAELPAAHEWCQMIGFIGNEVYIMTGGYDWDYVGGGSGGYHNIYVYNVSRDSGDEFVRKFKIYPPEAKVFGITKQDVFESGITLEGYRR